jgi:hypothetical protein
MNKIYIGDIGTQIKLDCGQDISTATTKQIQYKKPDGTTGAWTATIDTLRYLTFTTVLGTLDQAGVWQLQAYIVMPTWTGHGETADMIVFNLFT